MKHLKAIQTWTFLATATLLLSACRANLGNLFDLY